MKKQIKNSLIVVVVATLLALAIFLFAGVYPFSDTSILFSDLNVQYTPFYYWFKDVLEGKESIFFTYQVGLGQNMYPNFVYYLTNPVLLLLRFVNENDIPKFVSWLVLSNFVFASLSMYYYLNYRFKQISFKFQLILALSFGFMNYNVAFYLNTMWIACIAFFPILLIFLDKMIIKKHFYPLLIIVYAYSIYLNFYISYMIIGFTFIYIVLRSIELDYSFKIIISLFIKNFLTIFLALGLTTIIWLPLLAQTQVVDSRSKYSLDLKNNIWLLWGRFIPNHQIYITQVKDLSKDFFYLVRSGALPHISSSFITTILAFLYLKNEKIKKARYLNLIIIILFIVSFSNLFLYKVWNAFTINAGYDHRFSFLFTFLLIYWSSKWLDKSSLLITKKDLLSLLIFVSLITFPFVFIYTPKIISNYIYMIILILFYYRYFNKNYQILILILIIFELLIGCIGIFKIYNFQVKTTAYNNLKKYDHSGLFYDQITNNDQYLLNTGLVSNNYTPTYFSSFASYGVINFLNNMGTTHSNMNNIVEYNQSNLLTDYFLGVNKFNTNQYKFNSQRDNGILINSNEITGHILYCDRIDYQKDLIKNLKMLSLCLFNKNIIEEDTITNNHLNINQISQIYLTRQNYLENQIIDKNDIKIYIDNKEIKYFDPNNLVSKLYSINTFDLGSYDRPINIKVVLNNKDITNDYKVFKITKLGYDNALKGAKKVPIYIKNNQIQIKNPLNKPIIVTLGINGEGLINKNDSNLLFNNTFIQIKLNSFENKTLYLISNKFIIAKLITIFFVVVVFLLNILHSSNRYKNKL